MNASATRPAVLASVLLLAACASGDPPEGAPPPSPGGGPPTAAAQGSGCAPLFISPAGEPFRAEPEATVCPLRAWFTGADANGDGALTRTEFRNDALRFFARLDLNGDGYVDGLEIQAYEHRIVPEILGRDDRAALTAEPRRMTVALQMGGGGGYGGGGGGYGGGGRGGGDSGSGGGDAPKARLEGGAGLARFGLLGEPEPVAASDLDFDGRVSRAEFATRADQRFASLDEGETGRLAYADLQRRLGEQGRGGRRSPGDGGGAPHGGRGGRGGGRGGRSGGFGGPQA